MHDITPWTPPYPDGYSPNNDELCLNNPCQPWLSELVKGLGFYKVKLIQESPTRLRIQFIPNSSAVGPVEDAILDTDIAGMATDDRLGTVKAGAADLYDSDFVHIDDTGRLRYNPIGNTSHFVTPEMFGASGDGTTDDTSALQDAIDSGMCVLGFGMYRTTRPIYLRNPQRAIIIPGTIHYEGNMAAVYFYGTFCNVFINTIRSDGDGFVVKPPAHTPAQSTCNNSRVELRWITAVRTPFWIDCTTSPMSSIVLCEFHLGRLDANYTSSGMIGAPTGKTVGDCIRISSAATASQRGYINANKIIGASCCWGRYGINVELTPDTSMYGMLFDRCSAECPDAIAAVHVVNGRGIKFNSCTLSESYKPLIFDKCIGQIYLDHLDALKKSQFVATDSSETFRLVASGTVIDDVGNTLSNDLTLTKYGMWSDTAFRAATIKLGNNVDSAQLLFGENLALFYRAPDVETEVILPPCIGFDARGNRLNKINLLLTGCKNLVIKDAVGDVVMRVGASSTRGVFTAVKEISVGWIVSSK